MYKVIKLSKRHKLDANAVQTVITTINCNQTELGIHILPVLRNLAKSENLSSKLIGSDKTVEYFVKLIEVEDIEDIVVKLKNQIESNVLKYNANIKSLNKLTLNKNKKECRDSHIGIIPEEKVKDYVNPFIGERNYLAVNGGILVKES